MKRVNVLILSVLLFILLTACDGEVSTYQIPDIIGKNVSEAKLVIDGNVRTETVYMETNEYLPETVIGFGDNYETGDTMETTKNLKLQVATKPAGSFSHSDLIDYVYEVGWITGPDSENFDLLRDSGVGGTDLGIPVQVGDKMMLLYGDTFSGVGTHTGMWNSNFIALTEDYNLSDGLEISELVINDRNMVIPFAQGAHNSNVMDEDSSNPDREVTKIPTGGITIGDDVYIFYMSVRVWVPGAEWRINYNQVIKTDHEFSSFTEVSGLRWTEEDAYNFGQIYPFENPHDEEHLYFISIPGGRSGGIALSRVNVEDFENFNEYEYYLGNDNWVKGQAGLEQYKNNPHYIINPPASELSIMYNEYLEKWIVVFLRGYEIVFLTADELTGSWSNSETIVRGTDYGGLYGGFIHPKFTEYDGQKMYIQLSRWVPIYQTQLFEVVFK